MRFFLLIRTWIISIVLAGAVAFFGYQTVMVWMAKDTLEANQPVRITPEPHAQPRVAYRRYPPYQTFEVIAQKNLFSSDRKEKLSAKSPTPSRVQPPKPLDSRFALFGIVIDGNEKKALVSNVGKKNASEKAYIWVKIGDKIGNVNVSEITPEQIIITETGNTYTIRLSDQGRSKKRSISRKVIKRTGTSTKNIKKPTIVRPAVKKSNGSS